jgi:hypothetical protein
MMMMMIIIIIIIMLIDIRPVGDDSVDGSDCISELQLPMNLLFIPQVIYEHGEP